MSRVILRAAWVMAVLVLVLEACTSAASETPTPQAATASPTPTSATTLPAATSTPPATATPPATTVPTAPPASASPAVGLSGTWNGTWQDVMPDQAGGRFTLTWTQTGTAVGGGIVVNGTPCLSIAIVSGTVSGNTISFGAVSGKNTVVYTGTITGTTMKGTYTAPAACGDAKGTWGAVRK
jgi:hypothetical protein